MNRQQLPPIAAEPGLQVRTTEIRMPARRDGFGQRDGREVRA